MKEGPKHSDSEHAKLEKTHIECSEQLRRKQYGHQRNGALKDDEVPCSSQHGFDNGFMILLDSGESGVLLNLAIILDVFLEKIRLHGQNETGHRRHNREVRQK